MDKQTENAIKFIFVCCCFTVSLVSYGFCFSKRDCKFLIAGMAFTVVSDFFLVLRDTDLTGFYLFSLAHIAYALRVSKNYKLNFYLIIGTLACAVPAYIFLDGVVATAFTYSCFLIENVFASAYHYRKDVDCPKINRTLILFGVVLFFLCDANVLLFNLPKYAAVPRAVSEAAYPGIWVCYLSSQAVLAVSGFCFKRRTRPEGG